jgi:hypothetical protein
MSTGPGFSSEFFEGQTESPETGNDQNPRPEPTWEPGPTVTARRSLTLDEWIARELPSPTFLLGRWLSTTSRVLLNAPTGLGKTMFGMAMAMAGGAGQGFLHWGGVRPARVLFVDGEMSRRLLQRRLADEVERSGVQPPGFYVLSHEDVENFAPLNTPEGQAAIEREIKNIGDLDLIVFDNVMSLLSGDHKDEEGWRKIMPWVRSLTRRSIGQLWINHTGHDESRGYGTKTREWQMDTVIHLEEFKRTDTDVSFDLAFRKARERTPETRADFADVRIALVGNQWISSEAMAGKRKDVSPLGKKFFAALVNATIGSATSDLFGCPTAALEEWRAECVKTGLLDMEKKAASARSLLSKYRLELIAANWIAANETAAWTLQR